MGLKIRLFGTFEVLRDDTPIPESSWGREKTKTLLRILISERGRTFSADELIEAIWGPEINEGKMDPAGAAPNLRSRLTELRHALEPTRKKGAASQYILTLPQGYAFSAKADCWLDTEEFSQLFTQGNALEKQSQWAQALPCYEQAAQLYRGELLAEDRYAEWSFSLRDEWKETHLSLLERLAECHARLGEYRKAIARAHQILQLKRPHENAYQQLMLYYYLVGDQAQALGAYERCLSVLREEGISAEPGLKSKQLYEQIRARHIPGIDKLYPSPPLLEHELPYTLSPGSLPLVGRETEYTRLVHMVEQTSQDQSNFVLIGGEAGVGKTRLVQEVCRHAQQQTQALILEGRCQELTSTLAFQPLIDAIRQALVLLGCQRFKSIASLWLSEVANLVPELREAFPDLPKNPDLSPQQTRNRQFEGLAQTLIGLIPRQGPLLLFLDDLHWADSSTLEFLSYFLPRLAQHKVLVLGTYRREEMHDALKELRRAVLRRQLTGDMSLMRLNRESIDALLTEIAPGLGEIEAFRARLYRETDGSPLFVIAILQTLLEEKAIQVTAQGRWETDLDHITTNYRELMIPAQIREIIQRRVERLDESGRQLLRLASAIGRDFEFSLLERTWEENRDFLIVLENLLGAQLLVERQGRYGFSHDKIREIVYEEISLPRRQRLHQQVMQALEQLYANQIEGWTAVLAHHAHRAQQWKKTLEYALRGLKQAVKEYRHQEGLKLAELGLEAVQNLETIETDRSYAKAQHFELLTQRVEIYDLGGQRREQEQDLNQMELLAKQLDQKSKLALVGRLRSGWYYKAGRYSETCEEAQKALEFYKEMEEPQGQGYCLNTIGMAYSALGKYEIALRYHQQALQIREETEDRHGQGISLNSIAVIYYYLGQYRETLHYHQLALKLRQEIGDRHGQSISLGNLGLLYSTLGQYEEALRCQQQALKIRQEIGDRNGQSTSLDSLGTVYSALGQYEEALLSHRQAMKIRQDIGDRRGQSSSLANMGIAYLALGKHEEALRYHQQALQVGLEIGNRLNQGIALHNIADVYCEQRQYAHALSHYEQACAIFEELKAKAMKLICFSALGLTYFHLHERNKAVDYSTKAIRMLEEGQACEHPQEIYFTHHKILTAQSGGTADREYLQKAYNALMQRAEQIKDTKMRKSFLKNNRTHSEVIEAWEKGNRP